MFLTQLASLSSHSSIRERICLPNRGPCFRITSLEPREYWDRVTGLYFRRVRRSFTTGGKMTLAQINEDKFLTNTDNHIESLSILTKITPTEGFQCVFRRWSLFQYTVLAACLRHWVRQISNHYIFAASGQHTYFSSKFVTSLPSCLSSAVGDRGDAHEMIWGILITTQDFWPGIPIATHDRRTAFSNRFAQTPAGWYKPKKMR